MFIGTPNISRLRNRPKIFRITAAARTAKRSSASRPKKVTRVLRFRYTGVTSSGIVFPPLRHPACALRDEEFPEPKKTGQHQTSEPPIQGMRKLPAFGELEDGGNDEQTRDRGKNYVTCPVRQVQDAVFERHFASLPKLPSPARVSKSLTNIETRGRRLSTASTAAAWQS